MAELSDQLRLEMVVTKNWRGWSIGNGIRMRQVQGFLCLTLPNVVI